MKGDTWAGIRGWDEEWLKRTCVICGKCWVRRRTVTRPRFATDPDRCVECQMAAAEERFRWLASLSDRELAVYVEGVTTGAGGLRDPRLWDLVAFVRDRVGVSA